MATVERSQLENQMSEYHMMLEQNKAEMQRLRSLIEARNNDYESILQEVSKLHIH